MRCKLGITVIIPCYNVENYVGQMIKSLKSQKENDVEFIIVDDGSTDQTCQLIKNLIKNDSRFKLIEQENMGVSNARNTALQESSGEYIMFVDSDDVLAEDAIEKMYLEACKTNADIVYGKIVRFNSKSHWYAKSHLEKNLYSGKYKDIKQNPELFYSIGPCAKLYSRKVIENLYFPEEIIFGEDQYFTFLTYARAKCIVFIDMDVYFYRVRETGRRSLTQTTYENAIIYLESLVGVYKLIIERFYAEKLYIRAEQLVIESEYLNRMFKYEFFPIFKKAYRQNNQQKRALQLMLELIKLIDEKVLSEAYTLMKAICVELTDINFLLRWKNVDEFINMQKYLIEKNARIFEDKIQIYYPMQYSKILNLVSNEKKHNRLEMRLNKIKHGILYILRRKFATKVYRVVYHLSQMMPMKDNSVVIGTTKNEFSRNLQLLGMKISDENPEIKVRFVKKTTNKIYQYYQLGRAKCIIIDDYYYPLYNKKIRKDAEYIQIWHAMGALKKFGLNSVSKGDSNSEIFEYRAHSQYTKVICSSPTLNKIYADSFGISEDKIVNARLLEPSLLTNSDYKKQAHIKFKRMYPNFLNKKILLFAPTFRGSPRDRIVYRNIINWKELNLDSNTIVLVKLHPSVEMAQGFNFSNSIVDMTDADITLSELMIISNVLITDYSSVIFDYTLLNKPIIQYLGDLNRYQSERDTFFHVEKYNFNYQVYNTKELQKTIETNLEKLDLSIDVEYQRKKHFFVGTDDLEEKTTIIDLIK
ncbi:bifunctional glycosyltransferase/CDP-glycerol:glycerophosphate glycerophosphotransferase [Brochothrix thermosphacta]|uniref:bifunctional glycosyltransferase/CDP-glycerol:glycerophosphate glycerophosphotransferase n=1 Tax=Brochothrix thermosphacta TaxID=2756 RepID=UPI00086E901F|nr:CDP-glycerol glycerophosphotransferase family protein [Brochothrix thermosphacta]ODJ69337.1 hypothetical protein BFR43_11350 [Brochothrix thermosphacta]